MAEHGRLEASFLRRTGEWALVVLGGTALLMACAPERRQHVLKLLFDGVPDETRTPSAVEARRAAPADPATFAATVSLKHASFATQCDHCHVERSMVPADEKCAQCHTPQPHTAGEAVDVSGSRCSSCHHEHGGRMADLKIVPTQRCTGCHRFQPFESAHPELKLVKADPEEVQEAKYETGLEVFHATHLKQTVRAGARQGQVLDCVDCHVPDMTGVSFESPRFDTVCSGCHSVPLHKNVSPPDWAGLRSKIEGSDAELVLLSDARWRTAEKELEDKADKAKGDQQEKLEAQLDSLRDARKALKSGSTKDCLLCHSLAEKKVAEQVVALVPPTHFRTRWLERVAFSHQAHAYQSCTHCHHVPASASEELGRLMLPSIKTCTECHREEGASSTCSVCHVYHDRTPTAIPFGANEHEAIRLLNIGNASKAH
ncbi:MAG TPA: cytochrome c3 family protein [Phycisphaerae bacterium]|jgi:hypothetical protein